MPQKAVVKTVRKRVAKRGPATRFETMNDSAIHHHLFDTAIGTCGIAWSARGLVAVQLPESDEATTEKRLVKKAHSTGTAEPSPVMVTLVVDIRKYLAGERTDFSAV